VEDSRRGSDDDQFTVAEAAEYKGVGTRSVYKRIHDKVDPLPTTRRKPYMIRRADLDRWIVRDRYRK
jgi:excisionase family DNA binding protein